MFLKERKVQTMTDRDRLIELIKQCDKKENEILFKEKRSLDLEGWARIYADYLLANGVIVPPCKVGDMVWFDTYKKNGTVSLGIQPHKVDRIDVICVVGEKELIETKLHDWYFGESVFLTKEEAEAKLKELKDNDR